MKKIKVTLSGKTTEEIKKLFKMFYRSTDTYVEVNCINLFNNYHPEQGDEVITYKYKFHVIIDDKIYVYDGWCYEDDLKNLPIGIFSHWLLSNFKIYDGPSTAWYDMYVGYCNIVQKEK